MKEKLNRIFFPYADAWLTSSLASFLIFLFTRHSGIGLSPDSIAYLSTAEHIARSFSFTDFSGAPLINFPLGYPIFLACTKWFFSYPLLNALLFSGALFLNAAIMRRMRFTNTYIRFFFLLLFACCAPLLEVYGMLWSETLFLFLILLLLLSLQQYALDANIKKLVLASLVCSLLCSVRYAGISFLLAGITIVFFQPNSNWLKKIKHGLIFVFIASSLTASNVLRNRFVSGTLTGVRQEALRSIWENIHDTATVISYWLPTTNTISIIILVFVVLLSIIVIIYSFLKETTIERILALFFLCYIGFILVIASISRFETLSNRLLIPAFFPFFLLWYHIICIGIASSKKMVRWCTITLFSISYIITMHHQYQQNKIAWEGIAYAGIPGYAEDMWTRSAILAHIRKNPISKTSVIYSNANDALYYGTKRNAKALPHKDIQREINSYDQESSLILVWFFYGENSDLISLHRALQKRSVRKSYQFNDGLLIYCQ
ncbi:MAG: hypothetical protein IKD55_07395 [Sediminibacterium sp.]|nr:hypothetical protein [Sediminibacterium sp.]